MSERQPNHTPNPQRATHEGGNGAPGLPRTVHESAKPPPESQEPQTLPSALEILEREARLWWPDAPEMTKEERYSEVEVISRLQEEQRKRGTARNNIIRDLYYTTVRSLPHPHGSVFSFRLLSREEFQQFRAWVEPLSEEQIGAEIRKLEEEMERQREEYRRRHTDDPPTTAYFTPDVFRSSR